MEKEMEEIPLIIKKFGISKQMNLFEEKHLRLFNGLLNIGPGLTDTSSIKKVYSPPYASSDFKFEIRINGKNVPLDNYTWYPSEIHRSGRINGLLVSTILIPLAEKRAFLLRVNLKNLSGNKEQIKISLKVNGTFERLRSEQWGFNPPKTELRTDLSFSKSTDTILLGNKDGAISVGITLKDLEFFEGCLNCKCQCSKTLNFDVVFSVGKHEGAIAVCHEILKKTEEEIKLAREEWVKKINDIYDKLPTLLTNNSRLNIFYDRSLLSFLFCKWNLPDLILDPYYSEAGIDGGGICAYLWGVGYASEIFPLYDPKSAKNYIKIFLSMGITEHYAISPLNGSGIGPWYAYNAYSIVRLTYNYVLITHDFAFLLEKVNGKTVLDWMVYCVDYGFSKSNTELNDCGINDNLLELEKTKYEHFVPSPNGERYSSYRMIATLAEFVGKDYSELITKAEVVKKLIKEKLWDRKQRWLFCCDRNGRKTKVFTIQVFDLLRTGVLDAEMEKGILGHLNEKEFLSRYGIHSLSKSDIGYDENDVDWGGPGIYAGDIEIIEDLYKSNHPELAEDILKRVLWWGEHMPYYPQAIRDVMDYRRFPDDHRNGRANCIAGACLAQSIIFGLFGIKISLNGEVTIKPHPLKFITELKLKGFKIYNKKIDIHLSKDNFTVLIGRKQLKSKLGETVVLQLEPRLK